jgi:cob(I)alamin adenosyltransferase
MKMKIYTKTGDKGITGLYDGSRITKTSIFFDVLGEIDELSSRIGLLYSTMQPIQRKIDSAFTYDVILGFLRLIQENLQDINTIIATVKKSRKTIPTFTEDQVKKTERMIDSLESSNTKITTFLLPGATVVDAQSHLCRTQTRKVERYLWKLQAASTVEVPSNILQYVNRLSDFFFVLSRWLCWVVHGKHDVCK